ncbi:MAG: enoyl-CoA hydratase/isomerase family protein [Lautropia sp.]
MDELVVEQHGRVTLIRINRAERLNAIDVATAAALRRAFEELEASDQRAGVISGAGERAFSAGADLSDVPELWRCVPGIGVKLTKPLVAAVNGWCVGGAICIAMMADLIVAGESAKFYYPEAKLGFSGGMITSLAARMPLKLAMEIMLLGRAVPAERAYQVGFVNTVVPDGAPEREALAMAQQLAESAPMVLQSLKRIVNDHVIPKSPIEDMLQHQSAIQQLMNSADAVEGVAAFKEKRKPVFEGR